MIIGIDAHNVRGNGGSLVHLKELLNNASPDKNNFEKLVIWVNSETYTKLPQKAFIEYIILPDRNYIYAFIWQKFKLGKEAKLKKCNVLFFPGGIYIGKFKSYIVLAQSMLPFDETKNFYKKTLFIWILNIKKLLMLRSFKKANGIIYVSGSIKKQVEKGGKQIYKNTTVIYHGVSENFKKKNNTTVQHFAVPDNNMPVKLLTVSSHAQHKNLIYLVKTVTEIKRKGIEVELTIVGPSTKYGTKELFKEVNKLDPKRKFLKIIGDVDYEELPKFYEDADIFIITSLCESFGLPLLEAIASNVPILYQKLDSFNEIIENTKQKPFCIEFDFAKRNLKSKLLEMLNSKTNFNEKMELNNFRSWEDCSNETFKYLNKMASEKS